MALTSTRTHTKYWDAQEVDRVMGEAHRTLEVDYLRRKDAISKEAQLVMEAHLGLLRHTWLLMLQSTP